MTLGLATVLAAAIAAPHALSLDRVGPLTAATIWMAALLLRAITALLSVVFLVVYLPRTELFQLVTHWCLHEVIPYLAVHLGLSGHAIGDAALIAPTFVLAASVLSVSFGLWRAGRRVQRLLVKRAIGRGPRESLIVRDGDVFVGVAGLRRPEILISAGALTTFDDEELDASLEHEYGHIAHRHRFLLVGAELCRALGRFLPGTTRAAAELAFHLERDADRFAINRAHEPLVLASAICKAAQSRALVAPALALSGSAVLRRIALLTEGVRPIPRRADIGSRALAAALVALVLASMALLPAAVHAGFDGARGASAERHCAS